MSKFKVGVGVEFVGPADKGYFTVEGFERLLGENYYQLSNLTGLYKEDMLRGVEAPLTKLQAMHTMLDGQVYVDGNGYKFYATNLTSLTESTEYLVTTGYGGPDGIEDFWEDVANWTPYTPPKEWYEEIPEGGVLCWVSDDDKEKRYNTAVISSYINDSTYSFRQKMIGWRYATPVKPEECLQPKEV